MNIAKLTSLSGPYGRAGIALAWSADECGSSGSPGSRKTSSYPPVSSNVASYASWEIHWKQERVDGIMTTLH